MKKVYLIGAGPGAEDLITVRGARILAQADVVLYDALVEPKLLEYAPHARLVNVGKRCGQRSTAQHFINKQLIDYAKRYDVIVRLKGGDPMLFGRAEEEMRALEQAGITFEVVPGVTSALAAAATIQRSLTLRGVARSVAFATSAQALEANEITEAAQADSLVFYMGRRQANTIAKQLLAYRSPQTPVVIIESCSTPRERIMQLSLKELAQPEIHHWFKSTEPCLLMVGEAFVLRTIKAVQQAKQCAQA